MKGTTLAIVAVLATGVAGAQLTGVSRPEQVPVTTSPEGIGQPVVYDAQTERVAESRQEAQLNSAQAALPASPALKPRAGVPVTEPGTPITTPTSSYVPYNPPGSGLPPSASGSSTKPRPERGFNAPEPAADPDANIVTRIAGPANQLPIGTRLMVRLSDALSTRATKPGQEFHAALTEPVERDGRVLLPVGSEVLGKVTEVHGGKRISGAASLHLTPTTVILPDGTRYGFRGQVIDTGLYNSTRVDDEGTIVRKDHAGRTAAVFALAAGSGAAAGAVFGGVPGALIGAAAGAGVSTVIWLKGVRQTELPMGTKVVFALDQPMVIGVE